MRHLKIMNIQNTRPVLRNKQYIIRLTRSQKHIISRQDRFNTQSSKQT